MKKYFVGEGISVTDGISMNMTSRTVELIDTGSTGRGTNVPGDGDFDFMVRCNLSEAQKTQLGEHIQSLSPEEFVKVKDGYRAQSCKIKNEDGKDIVADIDITFAPKSLDLEYTSDMCVRDRLEGIKEEDKKNGTDNYKYVIANILMAKKILKSVGLYKKMGSPGASEYGGFGGIGVENWVLQNGGSFLEAVQTYMDATKDEKGNDVKYVDKNFKGFVDKYPIFDFGCNHREGKSEHDLYSGNLSVKKDGNDEVIETPGFEYAKEQFGRIREIGEKNMSMDREQEHHEIKSSIPVSKMMSVQSAKRIGLNNQQFTGMVYILNNLVLAKNKTREIVQNREVL